MDTDILTELRDAVAVCEKEFSDSSKSISAIKEDDYPDGEAYIADFYECTHDFLDKLNDLITSYRSYVAALEDACTEQEE